MIHIISAIAFSLIVYLIGLSISSIIKEKTKARIFISIFIKYAFGSLALIVSYALIITSFKTIYLAAIFALLFHYVLSKPIFNNLTKATNCFIQTIKSEYKALILINIILISLILFQYVSTGYFMSIKYNPVHGDFYMYLTQAEYLNYTGIENLNTFYNNFIENPISGIAPYHWFDIYITGFLFKFFCYLSNMEIYIFIFFPFCYLIIFLSLASILEYYLKNRTSLIIILAFTLLFYVGYFPSNAIGIKGLEFYGGLVDTTFKNTPSYAMLALLWFYYSQNKPYLVGFLIAILPSLNIIYIYYAPILLLPLTVLCFFQSKQSTIIAFKPLLTPIATFIVIGLIYFIFGQNDTLLLDEKSNAVSFINSINFKVVRTITFYGLYSMIVFFVPLYFIVFLNIKDQLLFIKKHFLVLFSFFLLVFWGILGHAIYQTNDESFQLSSTVFMPGMIITLSIIIASSIGRLLNIKKSVIRSTISMLPIAFLIAISIYTHYTAIKNKSFSSSFSNKFIDDLKPYATLLSNPGVALVDTSEFAAVPRRIRPYMVSHAAFSKYITKKSAIFSISNHNNLSNHHVANSPFGQYLTQTNNDSISNQQAQINFLNKYKIPYILAHENININDKLKSLISKEFYDPSTKQKVYLLHY